MSDAPANKATNQLLAEALEKAGVIRTAEQKIAERLDHIERAFVSYVLLDQAVQQVNVLANSGHLTQRGASIEFLKAKGVVEGQLTTFQELFRPMLEKWARVQLNGAAATPEQKLVVEE